MAAAFETQQAINIPDAYGDKDFCRELDQISG